jgi:ATP-dependent Zn protease
MKVRELFLWSVLVVLAGVLVWVVSNRPAGADRQVSLTEFMKRVDAGDVAQVVITDRSMVATTKSRETFATDVPPGVGSVIPRLMDRHVAIDVKTGSSHGPWAGVLGFYTSTILPWFTLGLVLVALARVRAIEKRIEVMTNPGQGPESPNP